MKKILILFISATIVLASCQKPEEKLEVDFYSLSHLIYANGIIDVELNSVLNINADIFSNINLISTNIGQFYDVFWYKYGESPEPLNSHYINTPRTILSDLGYYRYDVYNIPISDSIYHSGDHYILSVQSADNPNIVGGTLHVLVK